MNIIIWILILLVVALIVALMFETSREWLVELWEWILSIFEGMSDFSDTPLGNFWFWAFYVCLLAGVWVLPNQLGLADYTIVEKIMYTVIFFVVDYFIVYKFMD